MAFAFRNNKRKNIIRHERGTKYNGGLLCFKLKSPVSIEEADYAVRGDILSMWVRFNKNAISEKEVYLAEMRSGYTPTHRAEFPIFNWDNKAEVIGTAVAYISGDVRLYFKAIPTSALAIYMSYVIESVDR